MRTVYLISLVCLLFMSLSVSAQKLYDNRQQGPYLLLFKLSSPQMEFLAKHPEKIDSQFLYHKLVGKVNVDSTIPLRQRPVDSYSIKPFTDKSRYQKCAPRFHVWDIRENGYFLEVSVNVLKSANYRLIENPLFNAGVYKIGYETFIFVEDSAGLPVYNASVHLDTTNCPFDSSIGGYKIKGKKISGILKIERAGDFTMTRINGTIDKINNTAPPKDNYSYSNIPFQGYLVTNKPKYKTWDTLFFKSFLVNDNGKPLKKKLIARLYQNGGAYAQELMLKPTKKGAYNGFFVINDSFIMDQEITITLLTKWRSPIKLQNVLLENYELKDINFELKADKEVLTPGGIIKFYATATTANRLPIMDGRLTFKVRISNVNFTDGDSVVIPFSKYNNLYTSNVQTDPSGVTVFELPDSIFTAIDGSYQVSCSLLTSDNESREAAAAFNYQTTRDRQEAGIVKDTLFVKRLYNMKSVLREMRIKIYSRKDILADSIFQTPFNLYLPPNIYMVQIYRGDTLAGTFYRQTQLPEVWGKRNHDSIHVYFKSSFDIPVFYRIYANNKLVASGHKTNLTWHLKDSKKNSYHIQYGILEGSVITPRFYSKSFHLAEKELKVDIIQPETVYPGQEVAIEIQVKNAYGKPINKVNLAAWAVSMQLDGIVTPDVPYLGLVKQQKELPTKNWPLIPFQTTYQSYIKSWQLKDFFLYKNEFFKLVYPNAGFQVLTDTTPRKTTEIEFYAHGNYIRQNIVWVKANDSLFWSLNSSPPLAVQRIKSGKYNFTIRTFQNIYTFKDVEILEGKKNFVCLQLDSLNAHHYGDTLSPGVYKSSELEMLHAHTMLIRYNKMLNDTFIIKVNGKVVQGFQYGYSLNNLLNKVNLETYLFNPSKERNKYKSKQQYLMYGILNTGDEVEMYWKNGYSHLFKFVPGIALSFTETEDVKDEDKSWTKEVRFFQQFNPNNYVFNNFWWDPYFKDTTHKKKPNLPIYNPILYHYQTNLKEFQYTNYIPLKAPIVYNSLLHLYVSKSYNPERVWLFNREDSIYSILQNYNRFGNDYSGIGMHGQRNLWSISPKKQKQQFRLIVELNDSTWYVKNIDIDSSVNLYLTLKPSEFRKLGKSEYILYDRLAKSLTREPLRAWPDTPIVNKGLYVIMIKEKSGKTGIEGSVIGPAIKYPVENAFVVLEKNGVFVRGAITNREGRFVMDNIAPGIYMLKIKEVKYHYWLHYNFEIKAGYNHLIQAQLNPFAWLRYTKDGFSEKSVEYESPAMHYNSYSDITQKEIMKLPQRGVNSIVSISKGLLSENASVSFMGSRTDGTRYFVDGVALVGNESSSSELREVMMVVPSEESDWNFDNSKLGAWSLEDRKKEDTRLNQMAGDKNAKRTRKDFKDYAYWIPNLYTNKQGKASFSVKYPDNVTSWRTFVPAMDGKRHSGLGELIVKSYKPIVTSLALPFFLTEGDSLMAFGRIMNYTGSNQSGNYTLKYNQSVQNKTIHIKDIYTDSIKVIASKPGDTLSIESSFELPNGYRDAEMRKILVNAATVISGKSMFEEIRHDTSYLFKADSSDIGMDIAIYSDKLALILEMITKVENLPAYDNRSIAAYLNALLIKKSVCATLKVPFTQEKQIKETMRILRKAQGPAGLFSWFKGGKHSYIVSSYVAEVMYHAHKMGYENNTWLNAAKNMQSNLQVISGSELVEYLLVLKKMERKLDYDTLIQTLKPNAMDRSQKLAYWRLLQLLKKKIPLDEINGVLEVSAEGNLFVPGTWNWRFAPITDDAANTNKAWQILFDANAFAERRNGLVEFMASECQSYGNSWIKAAEAMLAEAQKDSTFSKDFKPEVYVNDILIPAEKLPAIYHLLPGSSLKLRHAGSPVYVAANRKFRTYNPKTDSTQFDIKVSIPALKDNHFKAGEAVEMKVTVFAKRTQYNTVIDIPIPAGCVYGSKIQSENWVESHREYQMGRVLIFSDELPFGYYTFTIRVVPRFNGVFYTAPARSALMFYPDKAAYTKKTRWTVGK